MKVMSTIHL